MEINNNINEQELTLAAIKINYELPSAGLRAHGYSLENTMENTNDDLNMMNTIFVENTMDKITRL